MALPKWVQMLEEVYLKGKINGGDLHRNTGVHPSTLCMVGRRMQGRKIVQIQRRKIKMGNTPGKIWVTFWSLDPRTSRFIPEILKKQYELAGETWQDKKSSEQSSSSSPTESQKSI